MLRRFKMRVFQVLFLSVCVHLLCLELCLGRSLFASGFYLLTLVCSIPEFPSHTHTHWVALKNRKKDKCIPIKLISVEFHTKLENAILRQKLYKTNAYAFKRKYNQILIKSVCFFISFQWHFEWNTEKRVSVIHLVYSDAGF